jgi:hypothetical protein
MPLTTTQVPYTGPYSVAGRGKHKGDTCIALKRAMSRLGFFPWRPDVFDTNFNTELEAALDKWDKGKDGYGEDRWVKIRAAKVKTGPNAGQYALDDTAIKLIKDEAKALKSAVPNLGPIFHGGLSVLDHDLTHATDGISLFPAFDDAFMQGTGIIAPEKLTVYKSSSSRPGHAFYGKGDSKLRYWFGHLDRDPSVGHTFAKGDFMGRVAPNNVGGGPHCHVGVNVELLWGAGKQLQHHTDYTHGGYLIRRQLEAFKLV